MDGLGKKLGAENTDGGNAVLLLMSNDALGWSWNEGSMEDTDWIQEVCRDTLVRPAHPSPRGGPQKTVGNRIYH